MPPSIATTNRPEASTAGWLRHQHADQQTADHVGQEVGPHQAPQSASELLTGLLEVPAQQSPRNRTGSHQPQLAEFLLQVGAVGPLLGMIAAHAPPPRASPAFMARRPPPTEPSTSTRASTHSR